MKWGEFRNMSSYHSSFTYLNKNSAEEGFMLASFEPDDGFVDTFLDTEQVTDDSYDGVRKFYYGNKYTNKATISITLVKLDGSDFSVADNRKILRWLTGCRTTSYLDLYEGDTFVYSFVGNFTSMQQYKMDARILGIRATFTSTYPWAWSAQQPESNREFDCYIGEESLEMDSNGVLYKGGSNPYLNTNTDGMLFNGDVVSGKTFNISDNGILYNDVQVETTLKNESDDLYSYINLDVVYVNEVGVTNENGAELIIENVTTGECTHITNISQGEEIKLAAGQFIISSIPNKIFGDSFNFVWPRMVPGVDNKFVINGTGKGSVKFSYRYPIKVGDCAVDVDNLVNPMCDYTPGGGGGTAGDAVLGRNSITLIDQATKDPYTVSVINSQLYINKV